MRDLVVLEDSTIAEMVRNDKFVNAIPCLVNQAQIIAPKSTGCGACARKRAEQQKNAFARIKTCLAGLSAAKKTELKELLDAKNIRLVFATATGQISNITF